jgi:hypothetical protein
MLDYSDLTVIKNSEGIPTALGYTINSLLLQNNKPLFMSGGKKKGDNERKINKTGEESSSDIDFDELLIPAGLVCRTETICTRPYGEAQSMENASDIETIPEGLYEKLLALAEAKHSKKLSRNKNQHKKKNKTHKRK